MRDGVIGRDGALEPGQGGLRIGRAGFAVQQHLGEIGLRGGKARLGRFLVIVHRGFGVFAGAEALALHQRHIAHGRDVVLVGEFAEDA